MKKTGDRSQESGTRINAVSFQLSAVRNEKTRRRAKGSRQKEEFIAISYLLSVFSIQQTKDKSKDGSHPWGILPSAGPLCGIPLGRPL